MKRSIRIILLGLCGGLVLAALKEGFGIADELFWRIFLLVSVMIILGTVGVSLCYHLGYQKKILKAVELLNQGKSAEFTQEMQRLLQTAKGDNLRNTLTLNLAAGYLEMKEYDTALSMLEGMEEGQLRTRVLRLVHCINLCLGYYKTHQMEKAMQIYQDNAQLLQRFRRDKTYGGHVALLDILAAVLQEQYSQAETLLKEAQINFPDPRLQTDFRELADCCKQQRVQR